MNVSKALSYPHWKDAMVEEMNALEKNHTWELIDHPDGKKLVSCKWVFIIKHKVDGSVERYRVCSVAKGYTQTFSVDYQETFAPVVKLNSIRVLISLAANQNWHLL